MPKRLLIVEDHPIFADALALSIRSAMPDIHIEHADTVAQAKAAFYREEEGFDLVLLDLWLPDTHGFNGLIELRKLFPEIPIVIVSAFADPSVVHKAMVCGAAGFIPKSASKDALLQAIATVLAGDACPPLEPVGSIELRSLTWRLKSLTQQQLRVLQMLCQGLLNKQIAYELVVCETTVKAHVSEILRKLSVCSRTQAVLEVSRLDISAVLALYAAGSFTPIAHLTRQTRPNEASEERHASIAK